MPAKLDELYGKRLDLCNSLHLKTHTLCKACAKELAKSAVDAILEEAVKQYPILGGFHGKISRRAREFLGVQ